MLQQPTSNSAQVSEISLFLIFLAKNYLNLWNFPVNKQRKKPNRIIYDESQKTLAKTQTLAETNSWIVFLIFKASFLTNTPRLFHVETTLFQRGIHVACL